MEVDLLFLLLILAFYFLSHLGGKKRRQAQRQPQRQQRPQTRAPQAPAPEARQDPELDDALREIREALGWPSSTPPQTPAPEPVEATAPPAARPTTPPPSPRKVEPSPARSRHRETQQQRVPSAGAAKSDPYAKYTGIDGKAEAVPDGRKTGIPELKTDRKRKSTHPILKQLQDREGARNAIILAEIFNEPAWQRRGLKRR